MKSMWNYRNCDSDIGDIIHVYFTGCGRVQIEFSEVFAKTWEQNWIQQDDPTIFSVSFSKLSDVHLASDAFLVNRVKIN